MGRPIDRKEIKDLKKLQDTLDKKFSNSYSFIGHTKKLIVNSANTMKKQGIYAAIMMEELQDDVISSGNERKKSTLLQSLSHCCSFHNIEYLEYEIKEKLEQMRKDLSILNQTRGILSWLIISATGKQQAIQAYQRVKDILDSGLTQNVDRYISIIDEMKSDNTETSYYSNHELSDMQKELEKLHPQSFYSDEENLPTSQILKKYSDYAIAKKKIQRKKASLVQEIRDAISGIMSTDVLRVLEDISVDELSKTKQGFRVKNLKEYGIVNMALLFHASKSSLSSIPGWSDFSASSAKKIAEEYFHSTEKTMKLRLSTDEKTPESLRLLRAVNLYRQIIANEKETAGSFPSDVEIENSIRNCEKIKIAANWLFIPDRDKHIYSKSYYLLEANCGNVSHLINQVNSIIVTAAAL